jgi:hypothetical protein
MLIRKALLGVVGECWKNVGKGAGGTASGQFHPVPNPLRFLRCVKGIGGSILSAGAWGPR